MSVIAAVVITAIVAALMFVIAFLLLGLSGAYSEKVEHEKTIVDLQRQLKAAKAAASKETIIQSWPIPAHRMPPSENSAPLTCAAYECDPLARDGNHFTPTPSHLDVETPDDAALKAMRKFDHT